MEKMGEEGEPTPHKVKLGLEILLRAIIRSLNSRTMRFKGKLGECRVVIFIDFRSIYNFVDSNIMKNRIEDRVMGINQPKHLLQP